MPTFHLIKETSLSAQVSFSDETIYGPFVENAGLAP